MMCQNLSPKLHTRVTLLSNSKRYETQYDNDIQTARILFQIWTKNTHTSPLQDIESALQGLFWVGAQLMKGDVTM